MYLKVVSVVPEVYLSSPHGLYLTSAVFVPLLLAVTLVEPRWSPVSQNRPLLLP